MRKVIFILCVIVLGCETQRQTVCDSYCDVRVLAAERDALVRECTLYNDELFEFEDNCLNTCSNVIDYIVENQYKKDAEICLQCISDKTENPSRETLIEVRETCFKECNTRGGKQFFYTFYISPPPWECNGSWGIHY